MNMLDSSDAAVRGGPARSGAPEPAARARRPRPKPPAPARRIIGRIPGIEAT